MSDDREIHFNPLRILLLCCGCVGLGLLLTAGVLKPNTRGHGTHQQLGLPPCGILAWYGRPCPSCGMTTSWSNLMRGKIRQSLEANPAGTWLGIWVLSLSVWSVVSAIRARWFLLRPNQWFFLVLASSTLVIVLTVWVFRFFF